MTDGNVHDDLKALANGINVAIASLNKGRSLDFLLILVKPDESGEHVTLSTITGITEPGKIRQIGEHLIDMADAQDAHGLERDVEGHA